MPIYAYKCGSCGHAKDVLQKISRRAADGLPGLRRATFSKQLTAAGFQLKGSGWYATDFRGGPARAAAPAADAGKTAEHGQACRRRSRSRPTASTRRRPRPTRPRPSAGGCGSACACH